MQISNENQNIIPEYNGPTCCESISECCQDVITRIVEVVRTFFEFVSELFSMICCFSDLEENNDQEGAQPSSQSHIISGSANSNIDFERDPSTDSGSDSEDGSDIESYRFPLNSAVVPRVRIDQPSEIVSTPGNRNLRLEEADSIDDKMLTYDDLLIIKGILENRRCLNDSLFRFEYTPSRVYQCSYNTTSNQIKIFENQEPILIVDMSAGEVENRVVRGGKEQINILRKLFRLIITPREPFTTRYGGGLSWRLPEISLLKNSEFHLISFVNEWKRIYLAGNSLSLSVNFQDPITQNVQEGIDAGGLRRHFFDSLCAGITDIEYARYRSNLKSDQDGNFIPRNYNPNSLESVPSLTNNEKLLYRAIGNLLMLCYKSDGEQRTGFHFNLLTIGGALAFRVNEVSNSGVEEDSLSRINHPRRFEVFQLIDRIVPANSNGPILKELARVESWESYKSRNNENIKSALRTIAQNQRWFQTLFDPRGKIIPENMEQNWDSVKQLAQNKVRRNSNKYDELQSILERIAAATTWEEFQSSNERMFKDTIFAIASSEDWFGDIVDESYELIPEQVSENWFMIMQCAQQWAFDQYQKYLEPLLYIGKGMFEICGQDENERANQWIDLNSAIEGDLNALFTAISPKMQGEMIDRQKTPNSFTYNGYNQVIRKKLEWIRGWIRAPETSLEEISKLIKFATGSSTLSKDGEVKIEAYNSNSNRPSASTCFNTLKLCANYFIKEDGRVRSIGDAFSAAQEEDAKRTFLEGLVEGIEETSFGRS